MLLGVDVVGVHRQRAPHHALVLVVRPLAPALPRSRRSLRPGRKPDVMRRPETTTREHRRRRRYARTWSREEAPAAAGSVRPALATEADDAARRRTASTITFALAMDDARRAN
jgi:hypothetical protein